MKLIELEGKCCMNQNEINKQMKSLCESEEEI